ncbi:MAG: protease B nonderepressible form [Phylliscum demangeonii]|nr:MAG: protease B nonderepressible form [Phylliscum demangeonii]
MKRRITYLRDARQPFPADALVVTPDRVAVQLPTAVREHRISLTWEELFLEWRAVLEQSPHLALRWVSSEAYAGVAPFTAQASPGLHVYVTGRAAPAQAACKWFAADLRCAAPQKSFIAMPSSSSGPPQAKANVSAPFQYYQLLPSIRHFVARLQELVCEDDDTWCHGETATFARASYIDLDYRASSRSLVVTAFWPAAPTSSSDAGPLHSLDAPPDRGRARDTLEVGVLENSGRAVERGEVELAGFLTVVGEDHQPASTRFSFPSRHHAASGGEAAPRASYSVRFLGATGLHPTLRISLRPGAVAPSASCTLHAHLTLPSFLFADRHQLSDARFLASRKIARVRALYGETNLEDPDWVVQRWGSVLALDLMPPTAAPPPPTPPVHTDADDDDDDAAAEHLAWAVDVPLHLRYLAPTSAGAGASSSEADGPRGTRAVQVPWPVVFWACSSSSSSPDDDDAAIDLTTNPFDRVHLGYDHLFPHASTRFYHWEPRRSWPSPSPNATSSPLVEALHVPVLELARDRARYIEWGTVGVVCLGFGWVCAALWWAAAAGTRSRARRRPAMGFVATEQEEKKKKKEKEL